MDIGDILDYFSTLPHLLLEYGFLFVDQSHRQAILLYGRVSPETQEQLSQIIQHFDIFFGLFSLFVFLFVLGSRKRLASWTDVFLTLFWAIVSGSLLYFSFYQLQRSQYYEWLSHLQKKGLDPSTSLFQPLPPLDVDQNLDYASVLNFLKKSGSRGRWFYSLYLFFDLFLLISTTILHRQVFSITFGGVTNPALKFMVQRFPLAIASLDLYENVCLAVCMYYYSQMIKNGSTEWGISESFVQRIRLAIRGKFLFIYIVVFLQVCGLTWFYFYHPSTVQKKSKAGQKKKIKD